MDTDGKKNTVVYLYCDGACRGNPGPGGWGVLLRFGEEERRLYGAETSTTNNRMELTAAIKGLEALLYEVDIIVTTDSQYLRLGISQWIHNWKRRQWRTSQNKPVKNKDLWLLLDEQTQKHHIRWHWVKSHSGHVENEIADQLANHAIDTLLNE